MAAEDELRQRLLDSAELQAIVEGRIYGGRAPQNAPPPFVVWKRISAIDIHALDGRTGLRQGRFSVDCYDAEDYARTVAMAEAVADALQENSPTLQLELESVQDLFEDETPKRFRRALDFSSLELKPFVAPPVPSFAAAPLDATHLLLSGAASLAVAYGLAPAGAFHAMAGAPADLQPEGPAGITPTAPASVLSIDGLSLFLDGDAPVGQFVSGYPQRYPFVVAVPGVSIVDSDPAAEVYDQPAGTSVSAGADTGPNLNPEPAILHGLEINSGNPIFSNSGTLAGNAGAEGSVRVGFDNRRLSESPPMIPSPDYGYAGPADGVNGNPYPPGHPLAGQYRNEDPSWTGVPIPLVHPRWGSEFSLAKAWSRKAYTNRDRLQRVQLFTVLPEAPPLGAFRPGTASDSKVIPLFESDLDLTSLPNLPTPAGFVADVEQVIHATSKPFIHSIAGSDAQRNTRARYEAVPFDPANPGSTGGSRTVQEFGQDIGYDFSHALLHICFDRATPAQKRQLSLNVAQAAVDLVDQADNGRTFYAVNSAGGHVQQWGPLIAFAAWLTRGSPRANYFARYLPPSDAFQGGLGQGRRVKRRDWNWFRVPHQSEWDGNDNYLSHQVRVMAEGVVLGDANRAGGDISNRIGACSYYHIHYSSIVGMALALQLCGATGYVPRPEWWNLLKQYADVIRWHDVVDGSIKKTDEVFDNTGWRSPSVNAAVKALWAWDAAPADLTPLKGIAGSQWVRRELTGPTPAVYNVLNENWVGFRLRGLIQRKRVDVAGTEPPANRLPPASAFAVTVNGTPRAIDTGTAGHVMVRGENAGVAVVGPAIVQTDVVRISYDRVAAGDRALRFHDGTLVPSFTNLLCENLSSPIVLPGQPDGASFGSEPGHTGNPNGAADQHKLIMMEWKPTYLQAAFGISPADVIRHRLRVFRVRLYGRRAGDILACRSNSTSTSLLRIRDTNVNQLQLAQDSGGVNYNAVISNILPAGGGLPDANGVWSTISILEVYSGGGLTVHCRRSGAGGNRYASVTATGSGDVTIDQAFFAAEGGAFGCLSYLGLDNTTVEPDSLQATKTLNCAARQILDTIGTDARPMILPPAGPNGPLDNPVFSHGHVWNDRATNLVSYADGGPPDIYFPVFKASAELGDFPNYGRWQAMPGFWLDSRNTRPWYPAPAWDG